MSFIDLSEYKAVEEREIKSESRRPSKEAVEKYWKSAYELPEKEKRVLDLVFGKAKPENKKERDMLKEIQKDIKNGVIVDTRTEVF